MIYTSINMIKQQWNSNYMTDKSIHGRTHNNRLTLGSFIYLFLCTSHVHPKQPVLKLSISNCCSYDIYKELEQSILRRGFKDMYSCSGLMFIMVLLQGKALSALCSEQTFLCYRE